jgi:hypothetical protein
MANIAEFYPESLINPYPRVKISDNTNISPEILEDPALKLTLLRLLNTPTVARGYKIPRGIGKSRALLSRQTGMDCFDLGKVIFLRSLYPRMKNLKNIYEELEELFVKQNEHIKVLLISGAGKTDITPLAILDYKNKTSESVNGYDLMMALDCLVPNLTKEGLEHFIKVANEVLAKKE